VSGPVVVVHEDADALASAVAGRLATRIAAAQAEHGTASVVLTGGRIAEKVYATLASGTDLDAVDWGRVDLWWGDERFLPAGDPDRNETQARAALLDKLPLDPARVHPMPADGGDGDPDAAAERYAAELGSPLPRFDVVLLGIGEDGHVASVFPGHPVIGATGTTAGVRDSPKPPPGRTTLTLSTLNSADEVWIMAAGEGKADAVAVAVAGGPVPAAMVHGTVATRWLVDRAAAAKLP
jgi:6-phosphogluconolactonase